MLITTRGELQVLWLFSRQDTSNSAGMGRASLATGICICNFFHDTFPTWTSSHMASALLSSVDFSKYNCNLCFMWKSKNREGKIHLAQTPRSHFDVNTFFRCPWGFSFLPYDSCMVLSFPLNIVLSILNILTVSND